MAVFFYEESRDVLKSNSLRTDIYPANDALFNKTIDIGHGHGPR